MPSAIWKGQLSFGLLNVPVTLYSAEKKTDISLRMLDSRDQSRVRYERVNAETGEEVPWDEVVRGYEYDKGNYVVIDPDEIRNLMPEAQQSVDLETFVRAEEVNLMFFEKPYYLVPQKKYEKGYVLLREALKESGTIGISRVVIRTRGYLAAVMPQENALALILMRYPQELRAADEFAIPQGDLSDYRISERELSMSQQLIESMSSSWEPENYSDEYRDRLMKFIEEKVAALEQESGKPSAKSDSAEAAPASSNVVDMMDILKKSVASRKKPAKSGGGSRSRTNAGAESKPARKRRSS